MSIYEEVSLIIASKNSEECYRHYGVGGVISSYQQEAISQILNELRNGERKANIEIEKQLVLKASTKDGVFQKSGNIADFYMEKDSEEYFFEIKTAKPNIDVFEKSKTKLLQWVARRRKNVNVFLAIPYNPYYPEPYSRFTESGLMDPPNDLLVGEEYWNFIAGKEVFEDLLDTFDQVGKRYKKELQLKFKEIAEEKIDSY
jgi:hypothetical protein